MSEQIHLAARAAHLMLIAMAVIYTIRLYWFTRFKAGKERQAPTGTPGRTNPGLGSRYSLMNVAMPWAMESTRTKPLLYAQFVIFHLGVVAAILQTFTLYFDFTLVWHNNPTGALIFQILTGAAFVVAVLRVMRRTGSKYMRAISTPDDHFSLLLLTVWFFSAFLAANNPVGEETVLFGINGDTALLVFFWMTAFFLIYVPFSKISHYLYYPFTRYYLGKTLGRRGVYPLVRKND
jgi:nitrate reductase gamma subunit